MRNQKIIALLVLLFLMAASCASRKNVVVPTSPSSCEWMTANMGIQIEGNNLSFNDLSGQIRMRKDSILWLSITATIGIEVARAKISTDSIWVLNRLEKTYLSEPLDNVSAQLGIPISLPWVQSLLFDNNEGLPPVENQIVLLNNAVLAGYAAKIRYSNIKLNETTTFPLKTNNKMERIRIKQK